MRIRSTTILCVRRDGHTVMAGDGQVSVGPTVMKHSAKKVRRLGSDKILAGFAGASADAFTLFELFEGKLDEFRGNLMRAAVELAKEWRLDRRLHRLEALLLVADAVQTLVISGTGDVIEPDDGVASIGSGGNYALAAARALLHKTTLSAEDIVRESMCIAGELCVYTNANVQLEIL